MRTKHPPETDMHKVTGRNLREALHNVRQQYGERACIVETRSVSKRSTDGLGRERLIEVSVTMPGTTSRPAPSAPDRENKDISEAIVSEIEHIEKLVEALSAEGAHGAAATKPGFDDFPLGRTLLAAGASLPAVRHLRRLNLAEAGGVDLTAARDHLKGLMRTSGGDWGTIAGCHLFLGWPGAGKTDLVLATAAKLRELGKRVLVLSYAPRHRGEIMHLQHEASVRGYDAAILRDAAQLAGGLEYFEQYDAVLIDTPSLGSPALADDELHDLLAGQEELHRHMMLPLDTGLMEREQIWSAAREWNCDWLALSRLDLTNRPGKLVDILLAAPLPVSLAAGGSWPGDQPSVATPEQLLALIMTGCPDAHNESTTGQAGA